MNHFKKILPVLIANFVLGVCPILAQELPGYPFDAISKIKNFNCAEGRIRNGKAFGSKRSALIYDICVSEKFDFNATNIIRQSVERMIDTTLAQPDCLTKQSSSKINFISLLREALETTPFPDDHDLYMHSFIFISPLPSSNLAFSLGYSNFFRNPTLPGRVVSNRRYLSIAVNGDLIAKPNHVLGGALDFWAGMMALAILQNFGFESSADAAASGRSSSLIGHCLATNGKLPVGGAH